MCTLADCPPEILLKIMRETSEDAQYCLRMVNHRLYDIAQTFHFPRQTTYDDIRINETGMMLFLLCKTGVHMRKDGAPTVFLASFSRVYHSLCFDEVYESDYFRAALRVVRPRNSLCLRYMRITDAVVDALIDCLDFSLLQGFTMTSCVLEISEEKFCALMRQMTALVQLSIEGCRVSHPSVADPAYFYISDKLFEDGGLERLDKLWLPNQLNLSNLTDRTLALWETRRPSQIAMDQAKSAITPAAILRLAQAVRTSRPDYILGSMCVVDGESTLREMFPGYGRAAPASSWPSGYMKIKMDHGLAWRIVHTRKECEDEFVVAAMNDGPNIRFRMVQRLPVHLQTSRADAGREYDGEEPSDED